MNLFPQQHVSGISSGAAFVNKQQEHSELFDQYIVTARWFIYNLNILKEIVGLGYCTGALLVLCSLPTPDETETALP